MTIHHRQATPIHPGRVVVLGASGFVGSDLVDHLRGQCVSTLALSSRDLNLCQPSCVDTLHKIVEPGDALVLVSALTPDRGKDVATLMRNLQMAQHVAAFLEQAKLAHFVYISSDAVYADDANPVRETTPCSPGSFHGLMHFAREQMFVQAVKKHGIPCLVLRPCAIYGARDTHNSYGPNRFLRTALTEGTITLFGQGEEKRDHVYISDLSRLTALGLSYKSEGVLNVATGSSVTFMQVAQTVSKLCQRPVQVDCRPRATPITHRHFDLAVMMKAFPGFRYILLEDGLRHMLLGQSAKQKAA